MEFRFLGNSGLRVSAISYGNWLTHGEQIEQDAAAACVRAALDAGITTFDTADAYAQGRAEEVLGQALKGERREGLEVFTKVYFPTGPGGPNDSGLSRKHLMEGIDGSLKRLGMEYVDMYQAHRFDYQTPLEETMEAFADIVRAEKAFYIGVSEWTADQLQRGHALARELHVPFVSNQSQYNMVWRVIEPEVVPVARELGISHIVFSPLLEGVLTGKYLPGQPPPDGSRGATDGVNVFIRGKLDNDTLLERVQQLKPIADDEGLTLAQLALAWVLSNDNVASAIAGASKPEQISAAAAAAGHDLSEETLTRIDGVLADSISRDPTLVERSSPKQR